MNRERVPHDPAPDEGRALESQPPRAAPTVPYFLYWRYRHWVDHTRWDRRWGTETAIREKKYLESIPEHATTHAEWYEPIRWRWFKPMLAELPVDPRQFTFIDLGSGKGRALFFAALSGFRRVIGVEFMLGDATTHALPEGPLVVFPYNPFRGPVMSAVVARIAERARNTEVATCVLYKQPQCAGMFDADPVFVKITDRRGNGRWFMGTEPYVAYRVEAITVRSA